MQTSFAKAAMVDEFESAALETAEVDVSMYRTLLAHAAAMGVLADILLRDSLLGLGLAIWIALLALDAIALIWRAERLLEWEAGAWLMVALLCSLGVAWRDAGELQFLDFVATLGSLVMAAIALSEPRAALFAVRIRDTAWAGFRVVRTVVAGVLPIALRAGRGPRERSWEPNRVRDVTRATVFAAVLLVVFGSLLRGADPIFASIFALPDIDFGNMMSHIVLTGLFTWIVGGWVRSALLARTSDLVRAPDALPVSLSMLDITAALGTLNVLFGAYVVTQLGWFFGGEQFLRERTGLTAASYARGGFFEMVLVVMLVVPLLVATRALLRTGDETAKRHTILSIPLIGLLGAMIFSAYTRMQLYVTYYGLTVDRFYPMVFMAWLGVVLVWLAFTVLRGRPNFFFAGAVVSGMFTLGALNVAAPDTIVARVNIDRAATTQGTTRPALDIAYLASLSGEAVPLAVRATLEAPVTADAAQRCRAASTLLQTWGPVSRRARRASDSAAWRQWNSGNRVGLEAVGKHSAALRAVVHDACPVAKTRTALVGAVAAR